MFASRPPFPEEMFQHRDCGLHTRMQATQSSIGRCAPALHVSVCMHACMYLRGSILSSNSDACLTWPAGLQGRPGEQGLGVGFGRQGTWCASAGPPPAPASALGPDQARAAATHCPALHHIGQAMMQKYGKNLQHWHGATTGHNALRLAFVLLACET